MSEQNLTAFWEKEIRPRFDEGHRHSGAVYLDNAATTKPFDSVVQRVIKALSEYGSVHRGSGSDSRATTESYESSRKSIRRFVGASPANYVIFTKNTTEAINHAAALFSEKEGKVLVSDSEHSSNLLPWIRTGQAVHFKTADDGTVSSSSVRKAFDHHSIKLLAVTAASNVTGYKPPLHDLAEIAHQYGAKILIDVCQFIQHEKVDMRSDDDLKHLDFIAFSGHKMYAPFGSGVLIGPKKFFDSVMPYQIGGGNLPYVTSDLKILRFKNVQTHDPGSPNVVGAIAIEEAIKELQAIGMERIREYEKELVSLALDRLKENDKITLYAAVPQGTVIPFDIKGFPPKLVSEILAQEYRIATRAGSFCAYELIRKLKGISPEQDLRVAEEVGQGIAANIPGVVRASFSLYNNPDDVSRFITAVYQISKNGFSYYKGSYRMNKTSGDWSLA